MSIFLDQIRLFQPVSPHIDFQKSQIILFRPVSLTSDPDMNFQKSYTSFFRVLTTKYFP